MYQGNYVIESNEALNTSYFKMTLRGDTSSISAPGQFINIRLDGFFLRRPISLYDWNENTVTIIYKPVGAGTELMARMQPGQTLDALCGLGNGFQTGFGEKAPLLLGGGAGVAPLYALAKALIRQGKRPVALFGFNTAGDVFCQKEFESLGLPVIIATADGSAGVRGFVTDAMQGLKYDYFYACGPMPMFRAIERAVHTSGQYSFEERMGCGFGACMGCSHETKNGSKRICKEGPVLMREEIIW